MASMNFLVQKNITPLMAVEVGDRNMVAMVILNGSSLTSSGDPEFLDIKQDPMHMGEDSEDKESRTKKHLDLLQGSQSLRALTVSGHNPAIMVQVEREEDLDALAGVG